jgi:septum formation protein
MSNVLILASGSRTRADMLRAAGVEFIVERPLVDEEEVKLSLRAEGLSVRDQADALAEVKAISVSRKRPGFVIGADQMLSFEGRGLDKPADLAEARQRLQALRGKTHTLETAVVVAKDGAPIWRLIAAPRLRMRAFSDAFVDHYLARIGDAAFTSVGSYQLEGPGAQLFDEVEGDFFSVLGLPLLPLLGFLRLHGLVAR